MDESFCKILLDLFHRLSENSGVSAFIPHKLKLCPHCHGTGERQDPGKIGSALKNKRLELGIKLGSIANRMGYSVSYVCDLEHGNKSWSKGLIGIYENALKDKSLHNKKLSKPSNLCFKN